MTYIAINETGYSSDRPCVAETIEGLMDEVAEEISASGDSSERYTVYEAKEIGYTETGVKFVPNKTKCK